MEEIAKTLTSLLSDSMRFTYINAHACFLYVTLYFVLRALVLEAPLCVTNSRDTAIAGANLPVFLTSMHEYAK